MGKVTDVIVAIDELDLAMDNPRLPRDADSRQEALTTLVGKEAVVDVAESIADRGGLNPLERMGVYLDESTGRTTYIALEGNRRVAALMLLMDPDALPSDVPSRKTLVERLRRASAVIDFDTVPAVLFEDPDDAEDWVDMLHLPISSAPAGRKRWDTQQQTRRGSGRNTEALRMIEVIIGQGAANEEEMRGKITTLDRLLTADERCRLLGLRKSGGELKRVLPWHLFKIGFERIVEDTVGGKLNSRKQNTSADLNAYAQSIFELMGSPKREDYVTPRPLEPSKSELKPDKKDGEPKTSEPNPGKGGTEGGNGSPHTNDSDEGDSGSDEGPVEAGASTRIAQDRKIVRALRPKELEKFRHLYDSITTISAEKHPMLVVIGVQSFLDSLTQAARPKASGRLHARIMGTQAVKDLNLGPSASAIITILQNIDTYANLSKHHERGTFRSGRQLVVDMPLLTPVIVALVQEAKNMWTKDE